VEGDAVADETFVAEFSSWSLDADQDLDVLAPGDWLRGPFPGTPGYNHLPWWSKGQGSTVGRNSGNYFYVGGTSMAAPHVAAVAALMLEADGGLDQSQVETIMTSTAVDIGAGSAQVWDPFGETPGFVTVSWPANAAGEGLVQADRAVAAALAP
jgi:subtilisin family serine protease